MKKRGCNLMNTRLSSMSITTGRLTMSMYRTCVFAAFATVTTASLAFAETPTATAVLRYSEAEVGQMVPMEIRVSGANNVEAPNEISVDGLEIHQTGTARNFEMRNLTTTSSITYNYTIMPLKAGTFKIPS